MNVTFDVLEPYLPLIDSKKRFLILRGGAGSGKSVFFCQLALLKLLEADANREKVTILCARKVGNTISNSIFREMKNVASDAGITDAFKITHRNPMSIKRGESEIVFAGIDDPEKIKSFSRADIIWMEEATEFDFEDFKQLNIRLRGLDGHRKQMWLSFNPIEEDHWVRTQVWDTPSTELQADMHKIITTYKCNPHLDEDYIRTLEQYKLTDYNYYRIYALAEWGTKPEGLIYPPDTWRKYNDETDVEDPDIHCYGLDFGYNDPMVLIECKIKDRRVYVRERIFRQKLTLENLLNFMATMNVSKFLPIYADSASPDKISFLQRAGYNVQKAVKGDIEAGIQAVKLYSLYIHEESVNVHKELAHYSWKIDKRASSASGKTVFLSEAGGAHNHAMDAMRYVIQSIEARPEPFIYSPSWH